MPRTRRIVAGISGSPGNLPALRHAADLARVYDAALTFVHAWLPSGPEFAAWPFPSDPLVLQWQDDAWQRMWHALDTAFGGLPPDLEAEPLVMRGNPGPVQRRRARVPRARSGLNDRWPGVRGPGSNTVVDHGRMPWQNCDLAWSASRYAQGGRGLTTRAGSRTPGSTCC